MNITIVNGSIIPVINYGGTERVIWYLGKELVKLGHKVNFLVQKGSYCDFASVIHIDPSRSIIDQIPSSTEIVHFNFTPSDIEKCTKPYIITVHGNKNDKSPFDKNSVFVSKNHANRYGSNVFVYNGLDWSDYPVPNLSKPRSAYHFLGNAAWRVKNIEGAIDVIKQTPREQLNVLGGNRFNFKMGVRLTFSPRIHFYGMVGGDLKFQLLNNSKGLIFPVRWHEPFGLAIIESLYYGCPVFGTPYGSLSEIVNSEVGFLSNQKNAIALAIENNDFSRRKCHEYVFEMFNARNMAVSYLERYDKVLNGYTLNAIQPELIDIQTVKFLDWR